jgi:hypothetical protein
LVIRQKHLGKNHPKSEKTRKSVDQLTKKAKSPKSGK